MSALSNTISFLIYFFSTAISVLFIKGAEKRKSKFLALLGIIIPSIVAAFRESGIDYKTYEQIYDYIHAGGAYPIEYGWRILNVIAPSFEFLQFIAAIIFFGVSYLAIRNFEIRYRWISWLVTLSVSVGMFYNVTRQAIAAAFIFLGISYFYKKKYFKFAICVAAGALFHKTALFILIILPIYWLVMRRVKKFGLVTVIMSAMALISVPIVVIVIKRLGIFLGYIDSITFNFSLLFLLYTLPPLLYYALKPRVFKEDKKFCFCLALYLLVIPMQFLGMRIPFADRIMLYFRPMLAIVVPLIIMRYDELNKGKKAKIFYVLWFIFYHVIMGVVLNENGMYPYMDFKF